MCQRYTISAPFPKVLENGGEREKNYDKWQEEISLLENKDIGNGFIGKIMERKFFTKVDKGSWMELLVRVW